MGEKHFSSRVWRQTEGEGHEGGESQRKGNEERVGEEWKLRGAAGLGKGLKLQHG